MASTQLTRGHPIWQKRLHDEGQFPVFRSTGIFVRCSHPRKCSGAGEAPSASAVPAHILVTVEPKHGSNVPVIKRDDVMVHQGKDRDQVTDWTPAQGTGPPRAFSSSSMTRPTPVWDRSWRTSVSYSMPSRRPRKLAWRTCRNGIARVAQAPTSDHPGRQGAALPLGCERSNASPYFSLSDLVKSASGSRTPRSSYGKQMASTGYYGEGDLERSVLQAAIDETGRPASSFRPSIPRSWSLRTQLLAELLGASLSLATRRQDRRGGILHWLYRRASNVWLLIWTT